MELPTLVELDFYLKIGFAVILFILVMVALVKTIDGSKKNLRTKTPALFLIYILFIFSALMLITGTVIDHYLIK